VARPSSLRVRAPSPVLTSATCGETPPQPASGTLALLVARPSSAASPSTVPGAHFSHLRRDAALTRKRDACATRGAAVLAAGSSTVPGAHFSNLRRDAASTRKRDACATRGAAVLAAGSSTVPGAHFSNLRRDAAVTRKRDACATSRRDIELRCACLAGRLLSRTAARLRVSKVLLH
jgi:hypothetical protein